MVNDLLIIRCNVQLKSDKLEELRDKIEKQRETGTILLPNYCDALLVPKETAIGWLNKDGYPIIDLGDIDDD